MRRRKYRYRRLVKKETKHTDEIPITEHNRITYIYKTSELGSMIEIVCVSLEIQIGDEWITIVRYDNHHGGRLHRHTRIIYNDEADITDFNSVKKKGTMNQLLHWAIKDIQNNFPYYKQNFIKRNKSLFKDLYISMY